MRLIALLASTLLIAGCAGYRLGPTGGQAAGARSIQVHFFHNDTLEPRLIEAVNHALRKQLQQDGTYRLETQGAGDLVVTGVITRFNRRGASFQPGDVITVRDYDLTLTAKVTVTERATGKVLAERAVTGRTSLRVSGDLQSAEFRAVPVLAEDLARRATDLIVDGAW